MRSSRANIDVLADRPSPSVVLIVRHGRGRGRHPRYMQAALDHIEATRPALHGALRVHETGDSVPSLDGVAAVVFWLADPLREHFPACFAEASAIAAKARASGLRVLNPPDALSNTVKSVQARLWQDAGIPSPPQRRFHDRAELAALLAETPYPIILRSDDEHAQHGMHLCHSRRDAERAARIGIAFPGALTPLVDVRGAHRAHAPESQCARYHHKKRALVLGDRVVPIELFFSRSPIVASRTCTFHRYAGRRRLPDALASLLPGERARIGADRAYAEDGAVPAETLRRAVHALGLDFAAVDYADVADGHPVLWEANPHFRLPRADEMYLPRARRIRERHERIYDSIGDFLAELARRDAGDRVTRSSLRRGRV